MLRILAIRLLLPPPLRPDLGRVADPQVKLQLGYQTLEPACVPTGLHTDAFSPQPQNSGDRKCLPEARTSLVELPNAKFF